MITLTLDIEILEPTEIDLNELVKLTLKAQSHLEERLRCGRNEEEVESFIREATEAPYYFIFARDRGRLVGWSSLFVYTESMVYLDSWHPLVLQGEESDEIFHRLLQVSIEQVRNIGRNRLEVFLMNLTDDTRDTYERYRSLYEAGGMRRGNEWSSMTCDLSESELQEPELPDGFHLRPLTEVTNEELWPCYNASFLTSEDGRYLSQTEEQRRENFERFFDRSTPIEEDASLLLYSEDEIVGFMKINLITDGGFVNGVGIHPEYRRSGLARLLMTASLVRAKKNEMRYVILEVDVENRGAIELYKQVGFRKTHGSISHVWTG